jgi:hypothetical protein
MAFGISKAESGIDSYAAVLSDGQAMSCKGSKQSKASAKPQRRCQKLSLGFPQPLFIHPCHIFRNCRALYHILRDGG